MQKMTFFLTSLFLFCGIQIFGQNTYCMDCPEQDLLFNVVDDIPRFWQDPDGNVYNAYSITAPNKTGLWVYYRGLGDDIEIISTRFVECLDELNTRNNIKSDKKLLIFPNPGNTEITIKHNAETAVIQIKSINGNIIKSFQSHEPETKSINVSNFAKGLYIVSLISKDTFIAKTMVVQ